MFLYKLLLGLTSLSALLIAAYTISISKKPINIMLSLYNLAFSMWCFAQLLGELSTEYSEVLFWTRVNIFSAILIPTLFLLFVYVFLDKKWRIVIWLFFIVDIMLICFIPTRLFISEISPSGIFKYYPHPGPVYVMFAIFFVIQVTVGVFELIKAYFRTNGFKRNQVSYVLLASGIGFGGGLMWFFPVFGLDFVWLGLVFVMIYPFIAAYAILKHNLLDIRAVLSRGFVYSMLLILFSSVYFIVVAVLIGFSRNINSFLLALFVFIIISFVFEPIKQSLGSFIDKLIYGDIKDPSTLLNELNSSVSNCVDLTQFEKYSTTAIKKLLGAKRAIFTLNFQDEDVSKNMIILDAVLNDKRLGRFLISEKTSGEMWTIEERQVFSSFSMYAAVILNHIYLTQDYINKEKMAQIGELAASVAHEIKNPLTSMKALVQVLPENVSDGQFMDSFQDIMPRQISRINFAVEKLLSLARQNIVKEDVSEEINVVSTIFDILNAMKTQMDNMGIVVEANLLGDLFVNAERDKIDQIFINLIINAIDSMQDGGCLSISMMGKEIHIKDSGHGMGRAVINKIFDPYFTTKKDGIGLGLSIAIKAMKELGGNISVESQVGKGSKFIVIFP